MPLPVVPILGWCCRFFPQNSLVLLRSRLLLPSVEHLMYRQQQMRLRADDQSVEPARVFGVDAVVRHLVPQGLQVEHDAVAWGIQTGFIDLPITATQCLCTMPDGSMWKSYFLPLA